MRFAKRQMTWFRHQADVTWFETADDAYTTAVRWLASTGPSSSEPRGASGE
jgi:tRNA A37 N6-isopentenylltransferase MiaA